MRVISIASVILIVAASAPATTVVEIGDVGDMLGNAYLLPGGTDKIEGSLNYDADLYKFYWAGGDFHANTVDYTVPNIMQQQDCELFLFDEAGWGLWANNDAWDGLDVPVGAAYIYELDMAPGYYLLGVTINQLEPVDDFWYTIFNPWPYVSEPKSADPTSGPLAGWGNEMYYSWAAGDYVIHFAEASLYTGEAGPVHPVGIPEPATMGLLALGPLGLIRSKK